MAAATTYSLDASIEEIFKATSATRAVCDEKAKALVEGDIVPVPIQGCCSYTVYDGAKLEYVVQFRLHSLQLSHEVASLAHRVHGDLAPAATYHGLVGDTSDRPLYIYTMERISGVSYIEYQLSSQYAENSEERKATRKGFIEDVARFFAASWKSPQPSTDEFKTRLQQKYSSELNLLLRDLPLRYHEAVRKCLKSLPSIFSRLPMVLIHRDFNVFNIMVDASTGRLTGVIDWAEGDIAPFGQNLYDLLDFSGSLHLKNGWRLYEDHQILQNSFWAAFKHEVGELSQDLLHAIGRARMLGCLLSRGFTSRLANQTPPVPIQDDEKGRYNMLLLDGHLINKRTRFSDLGEDSQPMDLN